MGANILFQFLSSHYGIVNFPEGETIAGPGILDGRARRALKDHLFWPSYAQTWKGDGMAVSSGNAQLHKVTSEVMLAEEGPAGKQLIGLGLVSWKISENTLKPYFAEPGVDTEKEFPNREKVPLGNNHSISMNVF